MTLRRNSNVILCSFLDLFYQNNSIQISFVKKAKMQRKYAKVFFCFLNIVKIIFPIRSEFGLSYVIN